MGAFVKKVVKDSGLSEDGLIFSDEAGTTTSVVCVSSAGERSFLYCSGSTGVLREEDIDTDYVKSADYVFVAGANLMTNFDGEPCARFMKKMQDAGKFTVMDTAWDFEEKWLLKVEPVIRYLNLFMPSYDEAVKITGEIEKDRIADKLFRLGAKSIIIKMGAEGAYVCENQNSRFMAKSYKIDSPKDTTGAGDAFCAGFLSGLATGISFAESAKLGNAAGVHCVMEIGASTGLKPLSELLKFIKERERAI
jgi:sugar/nucleoside kinase (ribokinase family)